MFTIEELKGFNGQNGTPMYVAYRGRSIDVTASRFWRGGMHMKRHSAGADLSSEMSRAPHDGSVLDRFHQVGVLAPTAPQAAIGVGLPAALEGLCSSGIPSSGHHPHPMTVHFPIVFMMSAPLFTILFLGGWWFNYGARPVLLVFIDGLAVFIWRLRDSQVITRAGGPSIPYLVLILLLFPMVVVVAWYGATLTFPLRRKRDREPRVQ